MDLHSQPNIAKVNFPTPLKQSQSVVVEIVLLVVVAILLYMFMIRPKQSNLAATQTKLDAAHQQYGATSKNKSDLNNLLTQLNGNAKQIAELDEALPLNTRIPEFRLLLDSIITSSGMEEGNVSVNFPTDKVVAADKSQPVDPFTKVRALKSMDAKIVVRGTFDQFQALLQKFEKNGRLINVVDFGINNGKDGILNFNVSLQTYSYE